MVVQWSLRAELLIKHMLHYWLWKLFSPVWLFSSILKKGRSILCHIQYTQNFLSCMTSQMISTIWAASNGFLTFTTFVRFHSDILWGMCKGFITIIAFVKFLSWMNSLMYSKMRGMCKGFLSFTTFIIFLMYECSDVSEDLKPV